MTQGSVNVTSNQVTQQLLRNGKIERKIKTEKRQRDYPQEKQVFWTHRSQLIDLPKPGRYPTSVNSYRLVSLLFHLFIPYEHLILNHMGKTVESKLLPPQPGL